MEKDYFRPRDLNCRLALRRQARARLDMWVDFYVRLIEDAEAAAASDGKTADNGWVLFGKCAAEYAGMAEVADEQRNDLAEWQAYGRVVEGALGLVGHGKAAEAA